MNIEIGNMKTRPDVLQKAFGDTVTIIEPHHDDFSLSVAGTMLLMDQYKLLKKIKLIVVFGVSPGCSLTPSSVMGGFFSCTFECIEHLLLNITPGGRALWRKDYAHGINSFEENFEIMNKKKWKPFAKHIESLYEGTVLLPMGFKHPDHNLLSTLKGDYWYREYPYWWHREESFRKEPSLYTYHDLHDPINVQLEEIAEYKWKVFRTVYKDVQGQFNPKFGSARPYFGSVFDEEFYPCK